LVGKAIHLLASPSSRAAEAKGERRAIGPHWCKQNGTAQGLDRPRHIAKRRYLIITPSLLEEG
jgi:hypothetical protein